MRKITKILTLTTPLLALAPLAALTNTNTTSLQLINKEALTPSLRSSNIDVTVKDCLYTTNSYLTAHITGTYHGYDDNASDGLGGCIENAVLYITDDLSDKDGGWSSRTISLPTFSYKTDELQYHSLGGLTSSGEDTYIHINIKRDNKAHQDTLNVYVKEYRSIVRTHESFKLN